MSFLSRLFSSSDDGDGEQPCNVSGHDWKHKEVHGFYTHGVPYFGLGKSFRVDRKDYYKCRKCGKADFREKSIGTIKVDADSNELTVV